MDEDPGEDITDTSLDGPPVEGTGLEHPDWQPTIDSPELEGKLAQLGVKLFTIPAPTGDEKLRLEGWRQGVEEHGQELWRIYHWIVAAQDGKTHGIYRLRRWLEEFNVPDNTDGEHWREGGYDR